MAARTTSSFRPSRGRLALRDARDHLREARAGAGVDVAPHDFRRTVATQMASTTSLAHATALLRHADESTTARHYVQRVHVAPDLRVVIDELVAQASGSVALEGKGE